MTSIKSVEIKDLSLVFDSVDQPVHALSDINLDISKGDFVSLIGPSGCGKTTLLRVIADLQEPTSGTISVNEKFFLIPSYIKKFVNFQTFLKKQVLKKATV